MEVLHGRKKEKVETVDLLKAWKERKDVLVEEYRGLKNSLKEILDSKRKDSDALQITEALLQKNPDYYSIWNVRRTILLEGFLNDANEEAANKIYNSELEFVEGILEQSPKSYSLWNHRRWCLEHMSQPRWDKELAMIDKLLELDARNFHGWDHRRYIIRELDAQDKGSSGKVLERAQSEFDFTTTKISQNSSNYSAWHNRGTLLGKLAENMTEEEKMVAVDNEFDLVKNAIHKDPEDQSAWLYGQWLIGKEERSVSILGATVISFHPLEVVVAFDETVKLRNPPTVSTMFDEIPVPLKGKWKATGTDSTVGTLWIFQQTADTAYGPTVEIIIFADDVIPMKTGGRLASAVCFELETSQQNLREISGQLGRLAIGMNLMYDVSKRIGSVPPPDGTLDPQKTNRKYRVTSLTTSDSLQDRVELLEREIAVVRELVELEPDCKWPIQILSKLLSELRKTVSIQSSQAKQLDDECIELQEKLILIDPLRQERYEDRRTQLVFDRETSHIIKDSKRFPEIEFADEQPQDMDLSMRGMTHIPISSYLMHLHTLNLDSNEITSTRFLRNLIHVRRVILSNNLIKRLEGIQHLPCIEFLSLENNLVAKWEDVVAGFMFWQEGKLGQTGGNVKVLLGNNVVVENEGGEYVLEKRWEDVGEVGVEIQWQAEEVRLEEETLIEAEGTEAIGHTFLEGTRRVSTTVVEFDAGH